MIAVVETATVPTQSLRPYARNARNGDTHLIIDSIRKHGQYKALVVNRPTMEVLVGNHTWMALCELGREEALVHFVEVDDAEAERINLVDNKSAQAGGFDEGILLAQLEGLGSLEGTGYDQQDLAKLLASTSEAMKLEDKGNCQECGRPL